MPFLQISAAMEMHSGATEREQPEIRRVALVNTSQTQFDSADAGEDAEGSGEDCWSARAASRDAGARPLRADGPSQRTGSCCTAPF